MPTLTLKLFGQPQVEINGETVTDFHSNKSRALLYFLAVTNQVQARTVLASLFWGDYPEDRAMSNLRKTLSKLNQIVGDYLNIERDHVVFDHAADYWVDVQAFESELSKIDSAGGVQAAKLAISYYQGDFLEGFYLESAPEWENWVRLQRQHLQDGYHNALLYLVHYHTDHGPFEEAIRYAQTLVNDEPWRDDTQRLLMALYAKSGQRTRALKQYELFCQVLDEELGIEPASETISLVEAIRGGEISPSKNNLEDQEVFSFSGKNQRMPDFLRQPATPAQQIRYPFVGREYEFTLLDGHLQSTLDGNGQIVFVTGEAGSGKSTLLAAYSHQAQKSHPDLIIASGNCSAFSGSGDPYHPFREILVLLCGGFAGYLQAGTISQEQAQRLWELFPITIQTLLAKGPGLLKFFVDGQDLLDKARTYSTVDPPWLKQLRDFIENPANRHPRREELLAQFVAVLAALARRHPLLLILDDLQWIDQSSLQLLFQLTRPLRTLPIFILAAYRPSELTDTQQQSTHKSDTSNALSSLLNEIKRRFGQVEINLDQVSATRKRQFVEDLINSEPNRLDRSFHHALYQHTRGHALFAVEMLRELQARGDLYLGTDGKWLAAPALDWDRLPIRIEAVISQRIDRLDREQRELLEAASVAGEEFSIQVLAHVLDRDERRLLHLLAQLETQYRLVHEMVKVDVAGKQQSRYTFNHILFQEYLYNNLSLGEKRLLHKSIAAALEALYSDQIEAVLVPLAQHYTQADQPAKAIPYLLAAGDRARNQNAFREATGHYEIALAFLKEQGQLEESARTLMKIALNHHNASNFEAARLANQQAFQLWQQAAHTLSPRTLPPPPHPLRIAAENFSGKLDPAMVKETPRALILQQLFSGLMRLGPDLELLPDLARGWDVLDEGRRYLFHLRQNSYWSDGTPVTAGDFEYAWKRVLDPATGSPNAVDFFDVKGARSFHLGETRAEEVGVTALEDDILRIELEKASPFFPNMLFFESTKPVPQHVIERYGSAWTDPDHFVTNGPFRLGAFSAGKKMMLFKNPAYHGSFTGNVDQVEITLGLGDDRLHHLRMYLDNELDILYSFPHLPPEIQKRLREERVSELRSGPSLAAWLIGFVLDQPPFDDRRVRKAFSMAIDRYTLANVIHRGMVLPATGGFLTPAHAAYSEGAALPYDPAQARRLLAEAGYPGGQGLPPIKMVNGHSSLSVEAQLQYLQAQWHDHLGVHVDWETIWNMGDFLQRMKEDPPHLFFIRWAGKQSDPDDYLYIESALVWDITRWQDETYFAHLERARNLTNWDQRLELYQQADKMLIEEAVLLPLAYDQNNFLVKPWVRRFVPSGIQRWPLTEIILEPH